MGPWRTTATGCAAGPGCLPYDVRADVLLFFCFLRLLQNRFSVVLHFQGGFIAHGHYIAVAAF